MTTFEDGLGTGPRGARFLDCYRAPAEATR